MTERQYSLMNILGYDGYTNFYAIAKLVYDFDINSTKERVVHTTAYRKLMKDIEQINNDQQAYAVIVTDGHYNFKLAKNPDEAKYMSDKYLYRGLRALDKYRNIVSKVKRNYNYDLLLDEFINMFGEEDHGADEQR